MATEETEHGEAGPESRHGGRARKGLQGKTTVDWGAIEREYVISNPPRRHRELAATYGVHRNTVSAHSASGGWVEKRRLHHDKLAAKIVAKIEEKRAEREATEAIDTIAIVDGTLARVHAAIEDCELHANSLDGLVNALCNLVRTRELLIGKPDNRTEGLTQHGLDLSAYEGMSLEQVLQRAREAEEILLTTLGDSGNAMASG